LQHTRFAPNLPRQRRNQRPMRSELALEEICNAP
jgi:hypothetical protein